MSAIELDGGELQKRRPRIKNMLKPLVRLVHPKVTLRSSADQINIFLGEGGGKLREIRSPCRAPGYFINYFEIWVPVSATKFALEKAYFHLDRAVDDGAANEEIVALHCDPATLKADKDYLYKRGPHMHFPPLPGDLGRAHIALCLDSHQRVTTDLGAFSNAVGRIVQMINVEMIPRLSAA